MTQHFSERDLLKAMRLEIGDQIVVASVVSADVIEENYQIKIRESVSKITHDLESLIGVDYFILPKCKPFPRYQLTGQEITILKGRQAEGYKTIGRNNHIIGFDPKQPFCWTKSRVDMMFNFVKNGEEYSIAELLKGNE